MQQQYEGRPFLQGLACRAVLCCSVAALGYLAVTALATLARNGGPGDEIVRLGRQALLPGAAGAALLSLLLAGAGRRLLGDPAKARRRLDIGCGAVCALCFCLAFWWGVQCDFIPRGTDMERIRQASLDLLGGQYNGLANGYFTYYPFQVGTALYFEGVFRLFGTTATWPVSLTNALWWALSVYCGYRITGCMGGGDLLPQGVYLMLAALCLPPLLYSPIFYGDVVNIGASFLAVWWAMQLCQRRRLRYFCGVAAVLAAGTIVRNTLLIPALAILLVFAAGYPAAPAPPKRWARHLLAGAGLLLVFGLCLNSGLLLNRYMRFRAGLSLGPGLPKSSWLVMGSKESARGCGWYDGWPDWVVEASGGDMRLADQKSRIELRHRYEGFARDPAYAARFFHQKMASQWADPTFESLLSYSHIWDDAGRIEGSGFLASVYDGALRPCAILWMDQYQNLIYLAALAWLLRECFGKGAGQRAPIYALLPVAVFLGGFFFYLFWEAKGRYCLPFFLMLLPVAACGVPVFGQTAGKAAGWLQKRRAGARRGATAKNTGPSRFTGVKLPCAGLLSRPAFAAAFLANPIKRK